MAGILHRNCTATGQSRRFIGDKNGGIEPIQGDPNMPDRIYGIFMAYGNSAGDCI